MNYKNKYLKYKMKYLNLKKMIGGGKPSVRILKNVNLFNNKNKHLESMEPYMNPMWGFISIETYFINNIKKIGIRKILAPTEVKSNKLKEQIYLFKLVDFLYRVIPGEPQVIPIKKIWDNITPKQIGGYLAHRYKYLFNQENIKLVQEIEKLLADKKECSNDHKIINQSPEISDTDSMELACLDLPNGDPSIYRIRLSEKILEYNRMINEKRRILYQNYNKSYQDFLENFINNIPESKDSNCDTYCQTQIFNNIEKIWNFKYIGNQLNFFRIILALVWFISNNFDGIKEYYQGINHFYKLDGIETIDSGYTSEDMVKDSKSDPTLALAQVYEKINGDILLVSHKNVNYKHINFTDCGESVIRNLVRLLIEEDDKYDVELLDKMGATQDVKDFFLLYKPFMQISNNKY